MKSKKKSKNKIGNANTVMIKMGITKLLKGSKILKNTCILKNT